MLTGCLQKVSRRRGTGSPRRCVRGPGLPLPGRGSGGMMGSPRDTAALQRPIAADRAVSPDPRPGAKPDRPPGGRVTRRELDAIWLWIGLCSDRCASGMATPGRPSVVALDDSQVLGERAEARRDPVCLRASLDTGHTQHAVADSNRGRGKHVIPGQMVSGSISGAGTNRDRASCDGASIGRCSARRAAARRMSPPVDGADRPFGSSSFTAFCDIYVGEWLAGGKR